MIRMQLKGCELVTNVEEPSQVPRGDTALHLAADLTSALICMKTKPALFDGKLARQLSGAADADESRKFLESQLSNGA